MKLRRNLIPSGGSVVSEAIVLAGFTIQYSSVQVIHSTEFKLIWQISLKRYPLSWGQRFIRTHFFMSRRQGVT
jgi:hypothetical protein